MEKYARQILIVIGSIIAAGIILSVYLMNQMVFFQDKEFERAVRESLKSNSISITRKREKPLEGIIWKKDLEMVDYFSISFRDYKVKDISDLKYFKNVKSLWLAYSSAYQGDTSIYEEEHILDNLYKIKDFKLLEDLHLYHLKINEDIESMFPDVELFIY